MNDWEVGLSTCRGEGCDALEALKDVCDGRGDDQRVADPLATQLEKAWARVSALEDDVQSIFQAFGSRYAGSAARFQQIAADLWDLFGDQVKAAQVRDGDFGQLEMGPGELERKIRLAAGDARRIRVTGTTAATASSPPATVESVTEMIRRAANPEGPRVKVGIVDPWDMSGPQVIPVPPAYFDPKGPVGEPTITLAVHKSRSVPLEVADINRAEGEPQEPAADFTSGPPSLALRPNAFGCVVPDLLTRTLEHEAVVSGAAESEPELAEGETPIEVGQTWTAKDPEAVSARWFRVVVKEGPDAGGLYGVVPLSEPDYLPSFVTAESLRSSMRLRVGGLTGGPADTLLPADIIPEPAPVRDRLVGAVHVSPDGQALSVDPCRVEFREPRPAEVLAHLLDDWEPAPAGPPIFQQPDGGVSATTDEAGNTTVTVDEVVPAGPYAEHLKLVSEWRRPRDEWPPHGSRWQNQHLAATVEHGKDRLGQDGWRLNYSDGSASAWSDGHINPLWTRVADPPPTVPSGEVLSVEPAAVREVSSAGVTASGYFPPMNRYFPPMNLSAMHTLSSAPYNPRVTPEGW